MTTYAVHVIVDPACTSIHEDAILETDSLDEAEAAAGASIAPYGAAIRRAEDGAVDWGFGFGQPVPYPS